MPGSRTTASGHGPVPTVWVLLAQKAGDNEQMLALAEALEARFGWPFRTRRVRFHRWELLVTLSRAASRVALDQRRSQPLTPPWPDLVLTAGRRNEPVARWIRHAAGGRTRLVHLGRPWSPLHAFDLVITTPQYALRARTNVVVNALPLNRVSAPRLAAAGNEWTPRFAHLPRPRVALLLGGDSGPFVLDARRAGEIARRTAAHANARSGSVLMTTSARTRPAAARAAIEAIDAPAYVHRFDHADATQHPNPYWGFLADADELVVTGESMSMLGEASATGRPLFIADLTRPATGVAGRPWWLTRAGWRWKPLWHRLGTRLGPTRMRRDVTRIQHALVASGGAAWLGEPAPDTGAITPAVDLERSVAHVAACFEPNADIAQIATASSGERPGGGSGSVRSSTSNAS